MNQNQSIEKIAMPEIKNMIMVVSGKGGVGKSTVAAGMAMSLAEEGYSVGLLDADIFGPSVPTLMNLHDIGRPMKVIKDGKEVMEPYERFGIKVMSIGFFFDPEQAVIWRGPMVSNVLKQLITETNWGELDYLIIDTPPGTGDIHITLLQSFFITGALVVTTPQLVAIADVQRAIGMLRDDVIGAPVLGIIENMTWFTPSKHPEEKYFLFGKGGGEKLSEMFNVPLIAQIPVNETICASCDGGKINDLFNDSKIREGFDNLTARILELTEKIAP
jgi:ATP-binding protein involved in chromosome partitioning